MNQNKKIFIASDHAGVALKRGLIEKYADLHITDLGTYDDKSVDYPDYAERLVQELKKDLVHSVGILICGSGQGMAIRANRHKEIRAALCWSEDVAKLSRAHNNANVLCLGARFVEPQQAHNIVNIFLNTAFEGGRHEIRVRKLTEC